MVTCLFIPVHNYQGVCVKLSKGMQLGAVRMCKIPDQTIADSEVTYQVKCKRAPVMFPKDKGMFVYGCGRILENVIYVFQLDTRH